MVVCFAVVSTGISFFYLSQPQNRRWRTILLKIYSDVPSSTSDTNSSLAWAELPQRYPVYSLISLPSGKPETLPKIQNATLHLLEGAEARAVREKRRQAVERAFQHAWSGYRNLAWLRDEESPISGGSRDTFVGWAATLIDSLDTLWIMELYDEFEHATRSLSKIDCGTTQATELNLFETTIRYLRGRIGAYDISGAHYPILLGKSGCVRRYALCRFRHAKSHADDPVEMESRRGRPTSRSVEYRPGVGTETTKVLRRDGVSLNTCQQSTNSTGHNR